MKNKNTIKENKMLTFQYLGGWVAGFQLVLIEEEMAEEKLAQWVK